MSRPKHDESSVEQAPTHSTAATPAQTRDTGVESTLDATQESLNKVRDILFGEQVRQQDRRYNDLQGQVAGELSTLRTESQRRLESLETLAKRDIATVLEQVKAESALRLQAMGELAGQFKDMIATADRRISSVDEQFTGRQRALQDEMVTQSRTLRGELTAQTTALKAVMENNLADLKHIKADRAALAAMFRDLAERLSA